MRVSELGLNVEELLNKYHWQNEGDYSFIGVRIQEEEFELGEIDHVSKVWIDGDETDEELNGICVIDIRKIDEIAYFGDHAAIIVGDDAIMGQDFGELIISDPIVVEILR